MGGREECHVPPLPSHSKTDDSGSMRSVVFACDMFELADGFIGGLERPKKRTGQPSDIVGHNSILREYLVEEETSFSRLSMS